MLSLYKKDAELWERDNAHQVIDLNDDSFAIIQGYGQIWVCSDGENWDDRKPYSSLNDLFEEIGEY